MSRTPFLSKKKTVHMILCVDMVCLNFFFLGDAVSVIYLEFGSRGGVKNIFDRFSFRY